MIGRELPDLEHMGMDMALAVSILAARAEETTPASTPEPAPTGPLCACGQPAGYQVHGDYLHAAWGVVAVLDNPRYCKACADKTVSDYKLAMIFRGGRNVSR